MECEKNFCFNVFNVVRKATNYSIVDLLKQFSINNNKNITKFKTTGDDEAIL